MFCFHWSIKLSCNCLSLKLFLFYKLILFIILKHFPLLKRLIVKILYLCIDLFNFFLVDQTFFNWNRHNSNFLTINNWFIESNIPYLVLGRIWMDFDIVYSDDIFLCNFFDIQAMKFNLDILVIRILLYDPLNFDLICNDSGCDWLKIH